MNIAIERISLAVALVITLGPGLGSAQAVGPTGSVSYLWQFNSQANPSAPEVSTGGAGTPLATIATGEFAAGWVAQNVVLGDAQGVWDLGRNGQITLSNSAGLAGDSSQARVLSLTVVQYQDGGIYDQLATVSVPGATLVSSAGSYAAGGTLGGWLTHISQWNVPAGAPVNSVVISGAYNGSLVDQVVVSSSSAVVAQPPTLSIQTVGSQVQLSWASSSATNWVLQSTADLNNPQGWAPVDAQVQLSGATASVTMDAVGTARFYRLKQP